MIKIEKTEVYGWEAAVRGMRNPLNSWENSDSTFEDCFEDYYNLQTWWQKSAKIGENDLNLMKSLAKAGSDHGKFLRMLTVTCDITAPLYWWKEFDTYKVGTVANSCSTMHKIHAKEFVLDDFSHEHLNESSMVMLSEIVRIINYFRLAFLTTPENKEFWWQMIQLLPSSYNQRRTVQMNYEVLRNMYHARKNHKLDEWHTFCDWVKELPYFSEICLTEEEAWEE